MTSCVHKMCGRTYGQANMKRAITPRMVDFCESYSPFHICLTMRPSAHLVYSTSHLSFVAYLVSWLAMIFDFCESYSTLKPFSFYCMCEKTTGKKNMERAITAYTRCGDGHMVKQTWKGLWLSQKSTIREIVFGILIGHDLSMRILHRFHGWLIFARVVALFMFVWP
jgi:hypothetical protein